MDRRLGRTLAIFLVIMILGIIALRSRARRLGDQLPVADPPPPCAAPETMRGDSLAGCDTSGARAGRR
jgi:hypothetical protein